MVADIEGVLPKLYEGMSDDEGAEASLRLNRQ
jgi:hypothetical protein